MSTTTKIFIVLVCLFAFLFTPMTIQFVARTHNWQKLAQTYQDNALTSQIHNRNVIALTWAEKQALADEMKKLQDSLRRWQDDNTKLQREFDQRNAAYATRLITWDELTADRRRLIPKLDGLRG